MNVPAKLIIVTAALLTLQTASYFGVQKLEGPAHDVKSRVDDKIPYKPGFIFVYIMWYPLIAVFPEILYYFSSGDYAEYIIMILTDIAISLIVYIVYPTSFERPAPKNDVLGRIMRIVYRCNYKGKNCMPSMHCSMCFIIIMSAVSCDAMEVGIRSAVCVLAVLIICSTLLTKQHVAVDVAAALILAFICRAVSIGLNSSTALKILGL